MLFDFIRSRLRAPTSQPRAALLQHIDQAIQKQPEIDRLCGLDPMLGPDFWAKLGHELGHCSVVPGPVVDVPTDTTLHQFDVPWGEEPFCRLTLSVSACGQAVHRFVVLSDFALGALGWSRVDRRFSLPPLAGKFAVDQAAEVTFNQLVEFCRAQPALVRLATPRRSNTQVLPSLPAPAPVVAPPQDQTLQPPAKPQIASHASARPDNQGDLGKPQRSIRGRVVKMGFEDVPGMHGQSSYSAYTLYVQTKEGLKHERGVALKEQLQTQSVEIGDLIECDFFGGGRESRKIYRIRKL